MWKPMSGSVRISVLTCAVIVATAGLGAGIGCAVNPEDEPEGDAVEPSTGEALAEGSGVDGREDAINSDEDALKMIRLCTSSKNSCPTGYYCSIAPGWRVGTCKKTTCAYNGRTYSVGASFRAADGCNTCSCMNSGKVAGKVACTLKACPTTCNYHGKKYAVGASWYPHDVCYCWCNSDGTYACNQARCF